MAQRPCEMVPASTNRKACSKRCAGRGWLPPDGSEVTGSWQAAVSLPPERSLVARGHVSLPREGDSYAHRVIFAKWVRAGRFLGTQTRPAMSGQVI